MDLVVYSNIVRIDQDLVKNFSSQIHFLFMYQTEKKAQIFIHFQDYFSNVSLIDLMPENIKTFYYIQTLF
jgi:hypothetical protein